MSGRGGWLKPRPKLPPDRRADVDKCPESWWIRPEVQADRAVFDATAEAQRERWQTRGIETYHNGLVERL